MGQAKLKVSATQRLIAEHPACCECGGLRPSGTREHMPPKAMFDKSHRPDGLVMAACETCNGGTSTADLVASVICRWGYAKQVRGDHSRLIARVRSQAPEVFAEWSQPVDKFQARLHLERHGVPVPADAGFALIGPQTVRQLNLFAHKVALCLHFEHFKLPLPNEGRVVGYWRTKEDFAKEGIPKVLLDLMRKYGTLEQGKWSAREDFEYRYEMNEGDGLFICLARFRQNLFVTGMTITDAALAGKVY